MGPKKTRQSIHLVEILVGAFFGLAIEANASVLDRLGLNRAKLLWLAVGLVVLTAARRGYQWVRRMLDEHKRWGGGRNPYPGLFAYGPELGAVFFGRTIEVRELAARVRSGGSERSRFIAVAGPSGSGKSSLVRAGLAHALRRGRWQLLTLNLAGGDPFGRLAALLDTDGRDPTLADRLRDEADKAVRSDPDALPRPVVLLKALPTRGLFGWLGLPRPLLLSIDQLEDIALATADTKERQAFLTMLRAALKHESRLRVVATLRSEFIGRFLAESAADLFEHPVMVKVMRPSQLREVITGPAKLTKTEFDKGLVDAIVEDTEGGDALPMLSYLLSEMYERYVADDHFISTDEYRQTERVEGVIAARANRIVVELAEKLGGDFDQVRRRVFGTLLLFVTVAGTDPARRRFERARLSPDQETIVAAFIDAHLLTSDNDESTGRPMVSLVHDALLRQWIPFAEHVAEHRPQLELITECEAAAKRWEAGGHEQSYLMYGEQLTQALPLLDHDDGLPVPEAVRVFLVAARTADAGRATLQANIAAGRAIELNDQDPQAALGIALRAVDLAPTDRARFALFSSLAAGVRHRLPHTARVLALAFTPQDDQVVTGCADGSLHIWTRDGVPYGGQTARHDEAVTAVAVLPDGRIISAGIDRTLRVWAPDGSPLRTLPGRDLILALAVLSDGRIVAGSADGNARILSADDDRVIDLPGHRGPVLSVAVAGDDLIATGCDDRRVRLWTSDGVAVTDFAVNTGSAVSLAFVADGQRLVTVSHKRIVQRWDRAGAENPGVFRKFANTNAVTVAADGRIILGGNHVVRVVSGNGTLLRDFSGHDGRVAAVAAARGGRVAAATDGTVLVWARPEELHRHVVGHRDKVYTVAIANDGRLATGSTDGTARLWNLATDLVQPPLQHPGTVFSIAFALDGRFATGSVDGLVRVFDRDGNELWRRDGQGRQVNAVAFGPDGRLVTGADDGIARIWSYEGRFVRELAGYSDGVTSVFVGHDGRIATGSADHTARLWSAEGEPLRRLVRHTGPVWSVALALDGSLATGSADGTAVIWSAQGRFKHQLDGHTDAVYSVAFAPDGRVATGSADHTVRVWTPEGHLLYLVNGYQNQVNAVAFGQDGQLITGCDDYTASIWPDPKRIEELIELGRACTIRPLSLEQVRLAGLPVYEPPTS